MSCPQCQARNEQDSARCHHCGATAADAYIPGLNAPSSQFRPAWRRLTRVEQTAAGGGLQFLLVTIGFSEVPIAGPSWEFGAYLALIASAAGLDSHTSSGPCSRYVNFML